MLLVIFMKILSCVKGNKSEILKLFGGIIMRIDEINNRINELETSIELLKAIRQDFVENNKEEIFIKALNDGINYTTQRLDKYKTTDWIMTID